MLESVRFTVLASRACPRALHTGTILWHHPIGGIIGPSQPAHRWHDLPLARLRARDGARGRGQSTTRVVTLVPVAAALLHLLGYEATWGTISVGVLSVVGSVGHPARRAPVCAREERARVPARVSSGAGGGALGMRWLHAEGCAVVFWVLHACDASARVSWRARA